MINIEDFDSNLLKIDKKLYENIDICYIGYITMKNISDYESINPLHFVVSEVNGFIEEKNGNTYLVFDSTDDKNKELITKYTKIWNMIKYQLRQLMIKTINGGECNSIEEGKYGKDFM